MSQRSVALLVRLLSVALIGAAACVGAGGEGGSPGTTEAAAPSATTRAADAATVASSGAPAHASVERGKQLFAAHCAVCHGAAGRGDGQAAYLLSPAPRDFGSARFRLVSTQNGSPTDEDLLAVLRRGMPGSAMPPWEWLPEEELRALAQLVRALAIEGRADDLQRVAAEDDEELARAEAIEIATRAMTPGDPVPIPPEIPIDAVAMQEGRRFFLQNCKQCHGADGTGQADSPQQNEDGTPAMPRDFTAGILKGGSTHADIVRRITLGLPGSPMPATKFTDASQPAKVAAYVRSLIKPGVDERVSQRRRTIRARRVEGRAPPDAADPAWARAEAAWLPLMPLWWRDGGVEGCVVRALHDGETLAVRVTWEDPSRDEDFLGQDAFTDSVALQWSLDAAPPMLSMGEPGRPVNFWQWRAGWELDLAAVRGIAALHPATPTDQYGFVDVPSATLYDTARSAGNPMAAASRSSAGEMSTAEGFGTLTTLPQSDGKLACRGTWSDGFWDVVMSRPLAACCPGELPLAPGASVQVAAAVWDGAAKDRNGQKAVTVWHVLELEEQPERKP